MTTLRPFTCDDLFRFNGINLGKNYNYTYIVNKDNNSYYFSIMALKPINIRLIRTGS